MSDLGVTGSPLAPRAHSRGFFGRLCAEAFQPLPVTQGQLSLWLAFAYRFVLLLLLIVGPLLLGALYIFVRVTPAVALSVFLGVLCGLVIARLSSSVIKLVHGRSSESQVWSVAFRDSQGSDRIFCSALAQAEDAEEILRAFLAENLHERYKDITSADRKIERHFSEILTDWKIATLTSDDRRLARKIADITEESLDPASIERIVSGITNYQQVSQLVEIARTFARKGDSKTATILASRATRIARTEH